MIHPDSKLRKTWDVFNDLLILGIAFEIPLRITLGYRPGIFLFCVDVLICVFFAFDIVLHFFTQVKSHGMLLSRPGEVSRRYLRTWFPVDLSGAIPFDLLLMGLVSDNPQSVVFLSWIRLLRLVKLARIVPMMGKWQNRQLINPAVLRLSFFMGWMLFIAHWISCGWILLGGIADAPSPAVAYLHAFYWTVTTLTTIGYGDILPVTAAQTLYAMAVMILGVGVYGYVIGNIASLLANIDVAKAQRRKKMEELNAFIKYRKIPGHLQERMRNFYEHLWVRRKGHDESGILSELPFSLKTDIAVYLNKEILGKVPLFKGAGEGLIRELAVKLKPVLATPGDYIFRQGEVADSMYFISRGTVEVVSGDDGTVIATVSGGNFFGEMSLLTRQTRTAGIRALEYCDLYILDKTTFDAVLERYPGFRKKIQEIAVQRQAENLQKR